MRWIYKATLTFLFVSCAGDIGGSSFGTDDEDVYDDDFATAVVTQKGAISKTPPPIRLANPVSGGGVWVSATELSAMRIDGPFASAWAGVVKAANNSIEGGTIADQYAPPNVYAFAKALVFAKTGNPPGKDYKAEVQAGLRKIIGTENDTGARTLSVGRKLLAWVIAADLVGLESSSDPALKTDFPAWLRSMLTKPVDGESISQTHERSPSNWGTNTGATRAAIAAYLRDDAELARVAKVFKGYLGSSEPVTGDWTSFTFHEADWQQPGAPARAITAKGAMKEGHSIDGAIPEDQIRGGGFSWPPGYTNYPWAALQGSLVQAEILYRQGYTDVWTWSDSALKRAVDFQLRLSQDPAVNNPKWWANGDDEWQPYLVNYRNNASFPVRTGTAKKPVRFGKNMGFTDWTHAPGQVRAQP